MNRGAHPSARRLEQLRNRLSGSALLPGEDGYLAATATWDESVPYVPPVVVNAGRIEDVAVAARWAADSGYEIGLLATGHGAFATQHDSVVVNVSDLRNVQTDAPRRRVTVGPGARWSDVQVATTPHGLVGLLGGSPTVGVTGYTLGGGLSPLGRTFGFAADRVTSLTVLDSEFRPVQVDAEREPELFWALRGGGGQGIVTELEFEVLPAPSLFGGGVYFSGRDAARVLTAYRDWVATLDERTSTSIALLHLPPIPQLPEVLRGQFVVHLRIAHVDNSDGDLQATGRALLAPMVAAAPIIDDYTRVMAPDEIPDIHRDPVAPTAATYRGGFLDDFDDATVASLADAAEGGQGGVPRLVEIRHLGGAMAKVPLAPNAATARASAFNLYVTAASDPAGSGSPRALVDAIVDRIGSRGVGAQLNFYGPAPQPGQILGLWSDADAARLVAAHDRLDPDDRLVSGRPLR
jgi:FAD/FMN-containing dehydrogenase